MHARQRKRKRPNVAAAASTPGTTNSSGGASHSTPTISSSTASPSLSVPSSLSSSAAQPSSVTSHANVATSASSSASSASSGATQSRAAISTGVNVAGAASSLSLPSGVQAGDLAADDEGDYDDGGRDGPEGGGGGMGLYPPLRRRAIRDYIKNYHGGKPMPNRRHKKRGRKAKKKRSAHGSDGEDDEASNAGNSSSGGDTPRDDTNSEMNGDNDGGDEGESHEPKLIFVDGKIVVVENLIEVGEREQPLDAGSQVAIRAEDSFTTSASFKKRDAAERWSVEETRKFFRALKQCGTDFTMLAMLFPNRTRKQIKRKYNREERRNPDLIDSALNNREKIDLNLFTQGQHQLQDAVATEVAEAPAASSEAVSGAVTSVRATPVQASSVQSGRVHAGATVVTAVPSKQQSESSKQSSTQSSDAIGPSESPAEATTNGPTPASRKKPLAPATDTARAATQPTTRSATKTR
eukprot:INCI13532.1.p1 GENE.INCI13532.1~~INCI13532.1.p1  ORF type:complete len:490 (-),score=94.46 INCI13532.1:1516-2913(-)